MIDSEVEHFYYCHVMCTPSGLFVGRFLLYFEAVEVDDEHAVLVRDKSTGQVRLVTEKQLFVPGPNETIEILALSSLLMLLKRGCVLGECRLACLACCLQPQESAGADPAGRPRGSHCLLLRKSIQHFLQAVV